MPPPAEVHITIDRNKYSSPDPTSGSALYALGGVQSGYDLFRESHGPGDDEPIKNDSTSVHVHNGDKFYTAQSTLNPGQR
jgi:hypothetical protein